jgi:hypothetical protein
MKMLTCACGERVRVRDDAVGVRCCRCVASGKAKLSEAEPLLRQKAAELGWPTNDTARLRLASELAMVWASCGLGHLKVKAVEDGILAVLTGVPNPVGDWHIRVFFEKNANGHVRPFVDQELEWRRVPLMKPPIDMNLIPPWEEWEYVMGPGDEDPTQRRTTDERVAVECERVSLGRPEQRKKRGKGARSLAEHTVQPAEGRTAIPSRRRPRFLPPAHGGEVDR